MFRHESTRPLVFRLCGADVVPVMSYYALRMPTMRRLRGVAVAVLLVVDTVAGWRALREPVLMRTGLGFSDTQCTTLTCRAG